MKKKLTLTVDDETVRQAKHLAREEGISLSSLFEQWSQKAAAHRTGQSLGSALRGHWKGAAPVEGDPRLEYLLAKHGK